jgi:hypothetical protein
VTPVPLNKRRVPRLVVAKAIGVLGKFNVSHALRERAYRRWRAGHPAEPCVYGKEQPIAVDCNCEGCIEKLCFFYFDQMATAFGGPP